MPEGIAQLTTDPVKPTEIIQVDSRIAACDGGDDALGHPRVFLSIPNKRVMCPYCSRLYVLNLGVDHADGH
nr:zinc-finger domain-containing protein [uncultured Rhodopila sp.]